ncbi:DUF1772 domain-containing protein [Streptomyces tateyamensis]|uniref:DUF1772 domain-containing protein n=1 Tax=Streptomyces tateyamensis TaxID=565073 RepID=A0A2V4N872_9ACTN|nr:anthrone oxygenase family protein [Streptomyces tateyamensis]PYC77701.1 DUF1772 domain-containing protein [Streptomyces tateyamensis]
MQQVLAVVTIVVTGMLVGVEFAVAVFINPIVDGLPHNGGLTARAAGGRLLGRVMPFWYIGALLLSAAWAAVAWGGAGSALVVTAAGLLVLSVVLSVALLVPINDRAKHWTPETAPADWREQLGAWDRLHYLRVAVIVASFVLLAVALARG